MYRKLDSRNYEFMLACLLAGWLSLLAGLLSCLGLVC